jgi:hypothetical protein
MLGRNDVRALRETESKTPPSKPCHDMFIKKKAL